MYSAAAGLSRNDIQTRVLDVLKSFEKVDGSKVSVGVHGSGFGSGAAETSGRTQRSFVIAWTRADAWEMVVPS
jgi:hypothetical protein